MDLPKDTDCLNKVGIWFGVVTLFPQMFKAITDCGVCGKAVQKGRIKVNTWNPRDFTQDKYRTVDDKPYGGGPGMLMKMEPLQQAIQSARKFSDNEAYVIYLSPQGRTLDQNIVRKLAKKKKIILVSGRYEGVDERVIEEEIDEELSVGEYVLSGGELPAMVLIDAVSRLVSGVLGSNESAMQDSFSDSLLEYPHYTRPAIIGGRSVPKVLLSGNHAKIRSWRLKQSLGRTWQRRPDLLKNRELTHEETNLLSEFIQESRG